ncbi:hypothetical protein ACK3Z8_11850 [Aeromonas caviae]|mgnify:CR=1 FL=1|nr:MULTISPECIES: hypothetical protein [Aeromonas]BBS87239.1 hypothetical protein WP7W18E02_21360 [Aeromonas media]
MSALDVLLELTPEQGMQLAAAIGGLWGTAWIVRILVKVLK